MPALCPSVQTRAVIFRVESFRNFLFVRTVCGGTVNTIEGNSGIKWQDGITVSEAVISMDTVSRHIKRKMYIAQIQKYIHTYISIIKGKKESGKYGY